MSKLTFAVLVVALLPVVAGAPVEALAQGPTDEQRAACQADFDRLCAGVVPGGGRVIACLSRQYAQLSSACKKVMDANKKQ
jgi:Cysteine rich repeat